jgi:hypothetical protein
MNQIAKTCVMEIFKLYLIVNAYFPVYRFDNNGTEKMHVKAPGTTRGTVASVINKNCGNINQAKTAVSISISFSTFVTHGASQASLSASFFSAQERTLPLSLTVLPSTLTLILSESKLALL